MNNTGNTAAPAKLPSLFTMEHAEKYAGTIHVQYPKIETYVFGDVARDGEGRELDILIEVSPAQFVSYRGICEDLGMHWIDKELKRMDPHLLQRPPLLTRSEEALRVIHTGRGRILHALDIAMDMVRDAGRINVVCIPSGFRNDPGLRCRLQDDMPPGCEEDFIERLAAEAIRLE